MSLGNVNGAAMPSFAATVANKAQVKELKKENQRTVGNPKLSEKAQAYYEKLKEKYGDMDFVLVSNDESENAMKNAEKYVTGDKDVVVIDEATVEKMANDENYRVKQEGVIDDAKEQLQKIANDLVNATDGTGKTVTGFGVQINADGTTTFFAVMAKANQAIVSKANDIRANANKAAKEAKNKAAKEAENKAAKETKKKADVKPEKEYTKPVEIKVEADNVEDLFKKIKDQEMEWMTETVRTPEEKNLGQTIDFTA
ncbi:MAG: DUF6033 family protein [Lachnospiraceae bacterium]|nr:DUF6033 family protein [Lachnospiraceae bacterium]